MHERQCVLLSIIHDYRRQLNQSPFRPRAEDSSSRLSVQRIQWKRGLCKQGRRKADFRSVLAMNDPGSKDLMLKPLLGMIDGKWCARCVLLRGHTNGVTLQEGEKEKDPLPSLTLPPWQCCQRLPDEITLFWAMSTVNILVIST